MAYLIDTDGKKHQGLDAFIPFLSGVPWGKWILPLWKLSFFRAWGYAAYKVVAKYRYVWFGIAK